MAVGSYILNSQNFHWPWQSEFTLAAEFTAAPAVSPGNGQEVRIAGVPVGDIREAEVTHDGTARITMAIEPGHTIYDNAALRLRPKSPLNEMYVEIDPGGPPGHPISEGAVLPRTQTQHPIQPDEVLQHLDSRSRAALGDLLAQSDAALTRAPERLPGGLRATERALVDLKPVVERLETRRAKIAELMTALARISSATGKDDQRLARLAAATEKTLAAVAARDDEIATTLRRLPGMTATLRRAMASTQDLTGELDPTLDGLHAASKKLPPALSRLRGTVEQLDRTVTTARPVVAKARPVVADLRPLIGDVGASLEDIRPVSRRLDSVTAAALPYLTDLQAFVYNTNSVFSLQDANGGIFRALSKIGPTTLPIRDENAAPKKREGTP
ncbi:MlaD family protein [Haloechinothrix salitolerans]|uniref:MlaD family protein n=1 Tax=Haloechinothrix salitolerans TaxID=926830 RepID=UPI0031EDA917